MFKEEPHKQNDFLRGLDREARDETMEKDIDISMDKEEGEGEALYNLDYQVGEGKQPPGFLKGCDQFQNLKLWQKGPNLGRNKKKKVKTES